MLIHAYRRIAAVSVNLFGKDIEFKAASVGGPVIADVAHAPSAERLLQIPEAYREFGELPVVEDDDEDTLTAAQRAEQDEAERLAREADDKAAEQAKVDEVADTVVKDEPAADKPVDAAAADDADAPAVNPLVLTNGTETLDITGMGEKAVRELAEANGVKLPGGKATLVADLRLMLADGLRAQE